MKKLIALTIIINVFLSSIYLLVEKQNGIYSSVFTSQNHSDSEDTKDSKNPLYTEIKSEKEDSKSNLHFNFKKLSFNPIVLNFNFSQVSKFLTSSCILTKCDVRKNIPVYLLNRSILI